MARHRVNPWPEMVIVEQSIAGYCPLSSIHYSGNESRTALTLALWRSVGQFLDGLVGLGMGNPLRVRCPKLMVLKTKYRTGFIPVNGGVGLDVGC